MSYLGIIIVIIFFAAFLIIMIAAGRLIFQQFNFQRQILSLFYAIPAWRILEGITRQYGGKLVRPRSGQAYVLLKVQGVFMKLSLLRPKTKSGWNGVVLAMSTQNDISPLNAGMSNRNRFRLSCSLEREYPLWGRQKIKDIEFGDKAFDDIFFVRSSDEPKAREVLTSQSQNLLSRIYEQFPSHRLEFRINGDRVELDRAISAGDMLSVYKTIQLFALLSQMVSQSALVADSIDFDQILEGETTCLICGEAVAEPKVECTGCKTEYHFDCWQYIGSCGRYACGEIVYEVSVYEVSDDRSAE